MIDQHLLRVTVRPDIVMERGEGCWLFDTKGMKYLDFVGGWATNSLGHCHPVVTKALQEQAGKLINASPAFYNQPMLEYAELLTRHSSLGHVFFGSSGAEVNESAIKLARKYGSKMKQGAFEIISLERGFHGRTLATMSMTGKPGWKTLFEPKVSGFLHAPINDFSALEKLVSERTCAVVLELIQGEGGVHEVDLEYLTKVYDLCRKEKILLVFDEIQTGMARTGKLFAWQHFQVDGKPIKPDIMTLGKGIGAGYPLAAMLCREELNIFDPGDNGGTYTAQPLAMEVGKSVLEYMIRESLWEQVERVGSYLKKKLTNLAGELAKELAEELSEELVSEQNNENEKDIQRDVISEIRGKGLLVGFTWQYEGLSAKKMEEECRNAGLLINAIDDRTIRLMPPLIITEKEVDAFMDIFRSVIRQSV